MGRGKIQFVGFVLAGGVATLANYGLFLILLRLELNYLLAAALGYLSGIVISFTINRLVVYRSKQPLSPELARYFVAYLVALVAQLSALQVLVVVGLTPEFGNAVAVAGVVVMNFFVVRRFVFAFRPMPKE